MYEAEVVRNTTNNTGAPPVTVVFDDGADDSWPEELGLVVTDEERAFARALVVEHLAELAEQDAIAEVNGWGPVEGCEVHPLTPDELVLGLAGPAHEMDLPLLASVHPDDLESNAARLAYVAGLDRVAAFVAAKRAEVHPPLLEVRRRPVVTSRWPGPWPRRSAGSRLRCSPVRSPRVTAGTWSSAPATCGTPMC